MRVKPEFIRDFAISFDRDDVDAIFISCGALRALDIIDEIEATIGNRQSAIGNPMICQNQAMI